MQKEPVLSHEEHMKRFEDLVSDQPPEVNRRSLLIDNLSMVVSDALQAYPQSEYLAQEHPHEWYVVGVLMYALGETSQKPLPVNLVSLGAFIKHALALGIDASRDDVLRIANCFSPGLFNAADEMEAVIDIIFDYTVAAKGGRS